MLIEIFDLSVLQRLPLPIPPVVFHQLLQLNDLFAIWGDTFGLCVRLLNFFAVLHTDE